MIIMIISFTKRLLTNQTNQIKPLSKPISQLASSPPSSYQSPDTVGYLCFLHVSSSSWRLLCITSRQHRIDWCIQCAFQGLVHSTFLESIMLFSIWKEDSLYPDSKCAFWHCARTPTWHVRRIHWQDSQIFFGIHCIDPSVYFENTFHTGSKYDVAVHTASLSFPWAKFLTNTRQKQGNHE